MKKLIVSHKPTPRKQTNASSTGYSEKLSVAYGNIDSNNDNGTCNVTLVTGFPATNIKIPSKFYPSKDPVLGGIDYPPLGAFVKIIHPDKDLNSGWIEPAELDFTDDEVKNALPPGTKLLPGGWKETYDQGTGEKTLINGTFKLILDPDGELVSLTDFKGNTFKNNGTTWEINGTTKVARLADTTKLVLSGIDVQALAVALLTTAAFVPTGSAPIPATTPVTFTGGEITSGSDKVKVG